MLNIVWVDAQCIDVDVSEDHHGTCGMRLIGGLCKSMLASRRKGRSTELLRT